MTDEAEVGEVTADVVAAFGSLDVLVNNAGIAGVDKPTHEVTPRPTTHPRARCA